MVSFLSRLDNIAKRLAVWLDERLGWRGVWEAIFLRKLPKVNWAYTLGSAALFVALLQLVTGILLTIYYVPTPDYAYDTVQFITHDVNAGWLIRGLHHYGASALILLGAPPEFDVPPERMHLVRHHPAEARSDRRWLPWSDATGPEVRAAYAAAGPPASPSVVLSDLEALARFKITGLLPDIACPVLAITGVEDRYIDKIRLERQCLPSVRYHEVPGAGHLVMWEQPSVTNRLIEEFMAEMTRPA